METNARTTWFMYLMFNVVIKIRCLIISNNEESGSVARRIEWLNHRVTEIDEKGWLHGIANNIESRTNCFKFQLSEAQANRWN